MQVVLFSAPTTVISEVTVAFCISMHKLTHVKIIKRRDTSNFSASTISSDKCQYVMVSWSFYDCVATDSCERDSIQKHLYLFRIEPIKRYVTISLHLSVWMWIPVNRPQWRNNRNCCAFNPSSDVCQYVVLRLFLFQCVATDTCRLNAKKKKS